MGLRGSIFGILEELEFTAVEVSPLLRRKKEERSKHSIENLSETSSQKSESLVWCEPLGTNATLRR
jgi:hypothetical protein